jgi:cell division protein FtsW
MPRERAFDRVFFFAIATLVVVGFLIFTSASLGLLAKDGAQFSDIALKQFLIGVVGGSVALLGISRINYRFWRSRAFYLFLGGLALTATVFTPLGVELNGARRWLDIGVTTFQPSEFLKLAYVIYLAAWFSGNRLSAGKPLHGLVPFGIITAVVGALILAQPNTGTFLIIAGAGAAMYLAAGARWRDLAALLLIGIVLVGGLVATRPYAMQRIETFLSPGSDPHGGGFQLQQSLIAIGSGGALGRGFGQSVQKFTSLPEPIGDSVFAVYAEEFGFAGALALIGLFLFVILRGYRIAARAPDSFGGLLVVGIITLIAGQALLNMGAMLGITPLTGVPLPFVSHGGTALLFALMGVGIVLNVSRYAKER